METQQNVNFTQSQNLSNKLQQQRQQITHVIRQIGKTTERILSTEQKLNTIENNTSTATTPPDVPSEYKQLTNTLGVRVDKLEHILTKRTDQTISRISLTHQITSSRRIPLDWQQN
jgi:phage shock protein A